MTSSTSRRRRTARVSLGAPVVALALLAVACGNDDTGDGPDPAAQADGTGTTGDQAPDAGDEARGERVTVVALVEQTGPTALPVAAVVEATAESINRNGGLNGHPIDVQIVDTRGDATTAQAAVRDIGDAVAVLLSSPSVEASIADELSALGVPIVGVGYQPGVWGGVVNAFGLSCETNADFCANPNFFTITTTFDAIVAEHLLGAEAAGATKVSSAACAEVDSCVQAAPVFEAIAAEIGLETSPVVRVSSTAADYSAECIGFMQQDVDFIQVSVAESAGIRLIESCLDQGYDGIFGASASSVTAGLLDTPAMLAGGLNAFPWFVDDEPVAAYREAMEAAGVDEAVYSSTTATGVYSGMLLLQAAIATHADPGAPLDGGAALAAMHQVQNEDLDGLIAPVSFSEDDLDRVRPCFWPYVKDEDGNLENPLGGLTVQCYPAR
jgi:branched-chain amino acid transport system substrate-binding protein